MGLFGRKSCPLEKEHLEVYGIHAPRKWTEADCQECQYAVEANCNYKEFAGRLEKLNRRGRPVVVKKAMMRETVEARHKAEADALKKAGLNAGEETEYWVISAEYDRLWEEATTDQKTDVLDRLDHLRIYLEKGESPAQAAQNVKSWILQREEFKKGKGE